MLCGESKMGWFNMVLEFHQERVCFQQCFPSSCLLSNPNLCCQFLSLFYFGIEWQSIIKHLIYSHQNKNTLNKYMPKYEAGKQRKWTMHWMWLFSCKKPSIDKHKKSVHLGIIIKINCNDCDFLAVTNESFNRHMKRAL